MEQKKLLQIEEELELREEELLSKNAEIEVNYDLGAQLRRWLSAAIKVSPLSRFMIAAKMSELIGREISKFQLDSWTAESKEGYHLPAEYLPAACAFRYQDLFDNRHPNYPNQGRWHELAAPEPGDRPDIPAYVEFVRRQVRELCTGYGPLAGFWWDSNDMKHDDPSVNALIRELQPGILINNRGFGPGDYDTPERDWDDSVNHGAAFTKPVEACQSVGVESWGFRADEDYYSERHLQASLAKMWARGGNFLLNAGPLADGRLPERSLALLNTMGGWLGRVRESYDGTAPASQHTSNPEVLLTRRDNTLYVHLVTPPASDRVLLPPLAALPRRAVLLNTGEPVAASLDRLPSLFREPRPVLRLKNLPVDALASRIPVIRLDFDCLDDVLAETAGAAAATAARL